MTKHKQDALDAALTGYPVVIERAVRWGEMDAFRHVNNTVYFRWFEDGRIAYFERLDLEKIMEETGVGPILGSTECRFRLPLVYPARISIGTTVSDLASGRFVMDYRIVSHRHLAVAAEGRGTLVAFDYRKGIKSRYPDLVQERIRALEKTTP